MYAMLRRNADRMKKNVVELTQQLVRTPSLSLQEGKEAELIEAQMKQLGFEKVFRDEAGNVIGIIWGRDTEPTILLNTHLDTVGPEGDWTANPYTGHIENGRLYGLGSADCKGGIAAHLYAGHLLQESLLPLRGTLVVAATVAEENGRSIGVRTLLDKTLPELGLKPSFAILGEPTDLGLYYGHDGWMEININVAGSNPFHVDDAANAIFKDFSASASESHGGEPVEMMMPYQPMFTIDSGFKQATVRMNHRLRIGEEAEEVLTQIKRSASQVAPTNGSVAVDVLVREEEQQLYNGQSLRVKHITNPWTTDPFHPMIERARQALAAAGCQAVPGKWKLARLGMGTAGSVLTQEYGIPTIGYGPGLETQAHSKNEYVEIEKIREAAYGTAAIIQGMIGIPVYGWTSEEI